MEAKIKFKKTPIGEVPENWEVVRLKDVLLILRNGLTARQNKEGVGYPVTRIETIAMERIDPSKVGFVENVSPEDLEKYRLYPGDILFSHINSLAHIGKTAIYEGKPELLLHGMNLLLLRPDNGKIDSWYLLWLLKFYRERGIFKNIAKKAVNQASINQTELGKLKIPLPPLPEQKKIAEILRTVDEAIEKTDLAIEKTERLKKGLMQRLLTRGIKHERFKKTEIGEIPEEWRVVRLEEVTGFFQYGLSIKMYDTGKYPIIKMDSIINGEVKPLNIKYVDLDDDTFKKYRLEKGDILINRTNSYELVGRTGVFMLDGDYVFASYLIRIRPDKKQIDSRFLTFYLIFANDKLRQLATRAVSQANINASNLKKFKIPLPPLSEQKQIAEILSTVDKKLELLRKRKEKLEKIKKGLMKDLLTGRRRVRI